MRHLSDEQPLGELESLKVREHETTLAVLCDLIEVERRKLHLKLGYASLFDFATRHLRYSESAAGRRIQAARCVARYPEVRGLLERDEVNLSTIAMVSRILNDTNKDELLEAIRYKSQREVESLVVAARPAARVRDRIKPVLVPTRESRHSTPDQGSVPGQGDGSKGCSQSGLEGGAALSAPVLESHAGGGACCASTEAASIAATVANAADHSRSGSRATDSSQTARVEQQFKIQFAVGSMCMRKFEAARARLSGRFPKGAPFAAVLEAALDALLEKKSPARRNERRKQRAARRQVGAGQRPRRVHIPVAVRDAVFERDDGHCTYIGVDGRRCNSKHDLEIDHREPLARGGTNAIDNLRLLCAPHNLLEAERVYGRTWMQNALT